MARDLIQNLMERIPEDPYLLFIISVVSILFLSTIGYYLYLINGYRIFRKHISGLKNENIQSRVLKINEEVITIKWIPGVLKKSWEKFYNEYQTKESETIPDPLFHFNENELVHKAGFRKTVEIFPAILVSIGILGTFIGITTGISDINTDGSVEILQTGVNTLLSGMKFAFYSSILGIFFSIVFQLIDRLIFYRFLQSSSNKLLTELDQILPVETESSLLDKMAKAQEKNLKDMREFFTDEFLPILTSGITESMSPHLEKSNEIMDKVAQSTMEAQSDSMNQMVEHFVNSLNEITGNQMQQLGDALHKTVEWQEKVHSEMNDLVEQLSHTAKEQSEMASNTTQLSAQMESYTDKLSDYQTSFTESTEELKSLTTENTKILTEMGNVFNKIDQKQQEQEANFDHRINQMNESVDTISQLGSSFSELNQELKMTMESLIDASSNMKENVKENQNLTETLKNQHELSNEWSTKTHALLEDVAHNADMNQTIQENLEKLHATIASERESLNNMQSDYSQTIANSVEELSRLWEQNHNLLSNSQTQFSQLNNNLSEAMDSFADHMQRGVQGTFEEFDTELKKAVEYLERGISNIRDVAERMEDDLENVNGQIGRFNEYLVKLTDGFEDKVDTK